ncbi:MAG: hypothetical protein PUF97_04520 [Bifidobacteriaceae bacterium]|nr:hypothetical protein [Bifidobacteriaceae bacterium]
MAQKEKKTTKHLTDEEVIEALTSTMSIKEAAAVLDHSYNWVLKKSHDLAEAGLIESRDAYPIYHRIGSAVAGTQVTVYFNAAAWKQSAYYIRGSFDGWTAAPGIRLKRQRSPKGYHAATIVVPNDQDGAEFFIDNGKDLNDAANLYQPVPGSNFYLSLANGSAFTIESFDNAHPGKPSTK